MWRDFLAVTQAIPGVRAENKNFSFTAHYRGAAERAAPLREALQHLVASRPADHLEVADALCAYEIKPRSVNKGEAVRQFLERAPFIGRRPMFIGDDASDEFGFRKVAEIAASPSPSAWRALRPMMCSPIRRPCGNGLLSSPPNRRERERLDRV